MEITEATDVVLFEVVDIGASARLAERLAQRRNVELNTERGKAVVVLAELQPEARDLAVLLREVESWVVDECLLAIRYELDGHAYVLTAGEAAWLLDGPGESGLDEQRQRVRLLAALRSVERLEGRTVGKTEIRGLDGLRKELDFALRLTG
jgi:hypothetical protein